MIKLKKIVCSFLMVILTMMMGFINVFADETINVQALINADPTRNISDSDLLIPNGYAPEIGKGQIITNDTVVLGGDNSIKSGGGTGSSKMTASQFKQIQDAATKGNVLITKDNTTLGINHGHAGIVYENCYVTVEALGYGHLSQWQAITTWKDHYKVRLYYPANVIETNRYAAGNYANKNLKGWTYQMAPSVNSTANLNCATLVWKSYKYGAGKEFTYNSAGTLIPQNMVEWWGMTQKVSVNWPGTGW